MAYQFQTVTERDLAKGIDARSSEGNIQPGYSEDLLNVDTNSSGQLSKRPGYQGHYGYLPHRIASITHSGTDITFTLDSSVDLATIQSSPIVVYGRLSGSQSGDWSDSNNAEYYSSFATTAVRTASAPSDTVAVPEADHGNDTPWLFTRIFERPDGAASQDNSALIADAIQISTGDPYDIDFDVTVPTDTSVTTIVADKEAVAGQVYTTTATISATITFDFVDADVNTSTDAIAETGHGLSTGHIIQLTTAGTLPAGLAASTNYYVIRVDADNFSLATTAENASAGTAIDITAATGGGTHTLTTQSQSILIPESSHGLTNRNFQLRCSFNNGSGEGEYVWAERIAVNQTNGFVEVNFLNSATATLFYVIMNSAPAGNVESATLAPGTSTITVPTENPFNFVAVYRNEGGLLEETVADSIEYDESAATLTFTITNSEASDTDYTIYYEAGVVKTSSLTVTDNGSTSTSYTDTNPQLTLWGISHNGLYENTTVGGHVNHIDSYRSDLENRLVAGLGGVLYSDRARTEATPTGSTYGADYLIPSTAISLQHRVDSELDLAPLFASSGSSTNRTRGLITDASISDTWASVTAVTYVSASQADFTVTFTGKTGTIASAIDTNDRFTVRGLANTAWNGTWQFVSVESESATEVVIRLEVTNKIIPEFNETGALGEIGCFTDTLTLSTTSTFAVGDQLSGATLQSTDATTVISVSGADIYLNGVTRGLAFSAGVTLYGQRTSNVCPVASTTNLVVGDMCVVSGYDRQLRVVAVDTANTTVTLDETVTLGDGPSPDTINVVGRWIPVEAPDSQDDLPTTNRFQYFDTNGYAEQSTVRSTMVADNLYLTNNNDEVLKFDGVNLYQAGLFRWQPSLFVHVDTETSSIVLRGGLADQAAAATGTTFTVTSGQQAQFVPGDTVVHSGDSAVYIVQSVSDDGTNGIINVTEDITDTSTSNGTIRKTNRYRYYFRLNAIDANQNIIASAPTGAFDNLVDLSSDGQIHMKLVGLPVWNNYDYDKLELEVYRTKADQSAPFFRVRTVDINFNHGAGYIRVVDSTNDEDLQDLDAVSSALVGAELGTGWEQPLRAKHITSINNRLVLGNVKDYPELDVVLRKTPEATSISASDVAGKTWLLKKDTTDASTTTNMVDRAKYEFVNSGAVALTTNAAFDFVDGDVNTGQDSITETAHGAATGDGVRLTTTGTLPSPLQVNQTYFVIRVDANTIKLAASPTDAAAGTAINLTAAAGGGTHSVVPSIQIGTTATNFTVNSASHGLAAGNWVYLFHHLTGEDKDLRLAGWFQIASVTSDTFTVDFSEHGLGTAGAGTREVTRYVTATNANDIPVWIGTDGNYNQVGFNNINEFTLMLRLTNAINASMRMVDTSNSTYSQFNPWVTANAGSEYGVGRMVLRQPGAFDDVFSVALPTAITSGQIFVNGLLRAAEAEIDSTVRLFPSRVIVSYPNYPEVFDNPFGSPEESTAVIDVNSADGQEITGIIPFFGSAAFGASQVEGVVVVFKTNSIYLLDVASREFIKIQSRGLGCTAPLSVADTRDGIIFANESGIYRLNRNQSISYVGKMVERIWQDDVNLDELAKATGHHYGVGRQYKLSIPTNSSTTNSQVLVYDHEREQRDQEFGAWTRYDNHPATGWANLLEDAFFGTTNGQVFSVRRLGDKTDYRDDASAISSLITLRAMDFDASGIRKVIGGVNSHFQLRRSENKNTVLDFSMDLSGEFSSLGKFTLAKDAMVKEKSAYASLSRRRGQHVQLRYSNAQKDEDLVLARVDYEVAGLNSKGLPEKDS